MGAGVEAGKVVSFHYTLKNSKGDVLDSSSGGDPLSYLHGAGNIVVGLETALNGKATGDKLAVAVQPAEGYGERHESGVHQVPRTQFPPDMEIQPGMQFGAEGPEGTVPVWVKAVDAETITIDFNHPLAGEMLHFDVEVLTIRDATAEEMRHGHPHGADGEGGHDHDHGH